MRSPGRERIDLQPTKEEKATIQRRAKAANMSVHQYCIAMAVDGKLPKKHNGN